ncbi:hypothetical protein LD771_03805 [Salmonella enterica]|nr:hypothetical protein [Salmonella enterica]
MERQICHRFLHGGFWVKGIIFGFGKSGKCYDNLQRNTNIVLNIPDARIWEYVDTMADTTGRKHIPDIKQEI